ncbi:MAG: hypothetical protein ACRC8C_03020 [Mycoplasmoidaceae bacterium]
MSPTNKKYKSAVTGIGIIDKFYDGKDMELKKWKESVGNTSVFNEKELENEFNSGRKKIIKFFHIFPFGEGNNINLQKLREEGIWKDKDYPCSNQIENKEQIYKWIFERLKKNENSNGNA